MASSNASENSSVSREQSYLESLIGRLSRIEEAILSLSVLLIAALASVNIFCRAVFGFSLAVTEELIQFCVIVLCFVGLSYAASQGRHIRMTAIYDQFSARVRRRMMAFIAASTTLLFAILTYYACRYVVTVFQLGGIYPATGIPFWWVYSIAPVGFALAALQFGITAFRNLTQQRPFLSPTVQDFSTQSDRGEPQARDEDFSSC